MYEIKKGYISNSSLKTITDSLKDYVDISWYESIHNLNNETDFWSNINHLLKSNYVLIDASTKNDVTSFETGIVWSINYIRKLLTRSGHKDAVSQLDKFGLCEKTLLSCDSKNWLNIPIKDQGKVLKKSTDIIKFIKNKES